jgi:glyoxylase-like metal-dependent hydrolase (beta-lactamase superfamily II)
MHTKQLGEKLFLADLQTGGLENLIASYIVKSEKTVIVDAGPASSAANLLSALKEVNVKTENVAYIALTHIHADHSGATAALLKKLPNAKAVVHAKGARHLKDPSKLWPASQQTLGYVADIFGEPAPVPEDCIVVGSEGMVLDLGERLRLKIVEAPGHASHNLAYFNEANGDLFVGDAAGAYLPEFDKVYPTTPPPFRPDIALISLEKLARLNPKTLYYAHFGAASDAVRRLNEYAAQIKMWVNIAQEGVKCGLSDEAIRQTIFEQDETIRDIVPALKANVVHKKTLVGNSVQGFIDFVRNPQI